MSSKPKRTPTTIGAAIVAARTKHNISQAGLATRLKISASHLCLIEQGKRGLTIALVSPLASILKLKPLSLLTDEQVKASRAWKGIK